MTAVSSLKPVTDPIEKEIAETSLAMVDDATRGALAAVGEIVPVLADDTRWNDNANAERFLYAFGDNLRYCVESDKWMVYSGRHWQTDGTFAIHALAREFVKKELEEAIRDKGGDKERRKNAERINNRAGFKAMLETAREMRAINIGEFDGEKTHYLLNCKNGTLDLKTGKLREHRREDFITRIIDADYNEAAECPRFDQFLIDIQPDPEIRAFLRRAIGYSLLGVVRERAFFILYGVGNNGKSIFTDLFAMLLGAYGCSTASQTIMDSNRAAGAASGDLARLNGKRYVLIDETNENEKINAALIKALAAGNILTARFLFKEEFDFQFTGKMWIATNHKPTVWDQSKGFWDRLKLIPFKANITSDKVIKRDDLLAILLGEASGVLNWAVGGCREYLEKDSLGVPPVIEREIAAYKHEQDAIGQFLEQYCQTIEQAREIQAKSDRVLFYDSDFQVGNKELFAAYGEFCRSSAEYKRSQKSFTQSLKERGFIQRNAAGRYWEGIRLLPERE